MGEITSENLALTCTSRYARICGSPPVFAPVVTQIVTQPLTLYDLTHRHALTLKGQYGQIAWRGKRAHRPRPG